MPCHRVEDSRYLKLNMSVFELKNVIHSNWNLILFPLYVLQRLALTFFLNHRAGIPVEVPKQGNEVHEVWIPLKKHSIYYLSNTLLTKTRSKTRFTGHFVRLPVGNEIILCWPTSMKRYHGLGDLWGTCSTLGDQWDTFGAPMWHHYGEPEVVLRCKNELILEKNYRLSNQFSLYQQRLKYDLFQL